MLNLEQQAQHLKTLNDQFWRLTIAASQSDVSRELLDEVKSKFSHAYTKLAEPIHLSLIEGR